MKLSELMQGFTPSATYAGEVTNADMVLAVDCSEDGSADVADYCVVQVGVTGLDAQLNPTTKDSHYLRAGQSTTKTGSQRAFSVSGDRVTGDEFQDFTLSHKIKYGVGAAVMRAYVFFCLLNGKGEKGMASIIVNSDSAGEADGNAEVDIEIRKAGSQPTEYTYAETPKETVV